MMSEFLNVVLHCPVSNLRSLLSWFSIISITPLTSTANFLYQTHVFPLNSYLFVFLSTLPSIRGGFQTNLNTDLNASNEESGEDVEEIKINELALSDKERDILYPSVGVNLTTESVFT